MYVKDAVRKSWRAVVGTLVLVAVAILIVGPNFANATSTNELLGTDVVTQASSSGSGDKVTEAVCPADHPNVVGGGYVGADLSGLIVYKNFPVSDGWEIESDGPSSYTVTAYAVCAN